MWKWISEGFCRSTAVLFVGSTLTVLLNVAADHGLKTIASLPLRSVADELCHALTSAVCWVVFEQLVRPLSPLRWATAALACLCGVTSSCLDVDHFVEARSFELHAAMSLRTRPLLHSTFVAALMNVSLCFLTEAKSRRFQPGFVFLLAWLPHHARDANRRGFSFYPLGETRPVPRWLYLSLIALSPALSATLWQSLQFIDAGVSERSAMPV